MSCTGCTRRAALAVILLSTGHALAKCAEKGIDVGPLKAYPVGTFKLIEADVGRIIVARDAKGVYAYSGVCTHMGGAIYLADDQGTSQCPSHQSMFGPNGEVIKGPATRPLPHFAVRVCEGRVLVDAMTIVDADVRAS